MIYQCAAEHSECRELAQRLPKHLAQWSCQLLAAELCYGIDPYLLAAIIDRESMGGMALDANGKGDHGHGHGLGQIDDRSHQSFIAARFDDGLPIWADPTFNIMYAARLLRRNITACRGELVVAIAAYNCGLGTARKAVEDLTRPLDEMAAKPKLDEKTTGGDYVTNVLARRTKFLQGTAPT